jgi:hypothetical protein
MVPTLFFYPLMLIALVWLCLMLQWAWPSAPALSPRSYWIPGSWHLRMVYTDAIPFHDPSQESNRAG